MKDDTISRWAVIRAVDKHTREDGTLDDDISCILEDLPPAQPERKRGNWTTEEVAELLFNLFRDDCACNFFGIDEWLPERCKYTEIAEECPNPKEKHGCWMQFLIQCDADMRGK